MIWNGDDTCQVSSGFFLLAMILFLALFPGVVNGISGISVLF